MTTPHQGGKVELRIICNPEGRFIDNHNQRVDIVWVNFDLECEDLDVRAIAKLEFYNLRNKHVLRNHCDITNDSKIELHTVHDPQVGVERRRAVMWSMYHLGYRTSGWKCPTGKSTNPARDVQEFNSSEVVVS